jgi:hypothetical protein
MHRRIESNRQAAVEWAVTVRETVCRSSKRKFVGSGLDLYSGEILFESRSWHWPTYVLHNFSLPVCQPRSKECWRRNCTWFIFLCHKICLFFRTARIVHEISSRNQVNVRFSLTQCYFPFSIWMSLTTFGSVLNVGESFQNRASNSASVIVL